jgi:hypothetical protein
MRIDKGWGQPFLDREDATTRCLSRRHDAEPMQTEPLVCAECGRQDPGDEPGWTLRLDVGRRACRVLS